MFRVSGKVGLGVVTALLSANVAFALPSLQLDIAGGSYDSATETIVSSGDPFTVYALLDPATLSGGGTFYLSAAIMPKTSVGAFGSFVVNGTTYSAGNMIYGNPPSLAIHNSDELASHGIFDTYYAEIAFTFDADSKALAYNAQDNPGSFAADADGSLLYQAFNIDMSGLAENYNVHFDLYNLRVDKKGNVEVDQFAPFSHDAQGGTQVPDAGASVALLGVALLGLEGFRRRFAR